MYDTVWTVCHSAHKTMSATKKYSLTEIQQELDIEKIQKSVIECFCRFLEYLLLDKCTINNLLSYMYLITWLGNFNFCVCILFISDKGFYSWWTVGPSLLNWRSGRDRFSHTDSFVNIGDLICTWWFSKLCQICKGWCPFANAVAVVSTVTYLNMDGFGVFVNMLWQLFVCCLFNM